MPNILIPILTTILLFPQLATGANSTSTPQRLADGWQVSSLRAQGFDLVKFERLKRYIDSNKGKDLQSVSVIRNKALVFDRHMNGSSSSSITDIRSATKSVISLLVGIALDKGAIASVDDFILPYFSDYLPIKNLDANKRRIRVRDLLTMTAGFDSEDETPGSVGNEDKLDALSSDWVRYSIDVPMINRPGTKWAYSSMNTFLLGYIIEQATGESLDVFAQENLFGPLGIKRIQWRHTPQGRVVAQGNFKISSRDMAKIGQLILDSGVYGGKRIVSSEWITASTRGHFATNWPNYDSYGYKWYNHTQIIDGEAVHYVFASGNGGNKIYIVPKFQLVVAVASTAYGQRRGHSRSLNILKSTLAAIDHESKI